MVEREKEVPGQHAGPTGVGNLPTPKERGGDVPFAEMKEWVGSADEVKEEQTSNSVQDAERASAARLRDGEAQETIISLKDR